MGAGVTVVDAGVETVGAGVPFVAGAVVITCALVVKGAVVVTGAAIITGKGLLAADMITSIGTADTRTGERRTKKAGNVKTTAPGGPVR